MSKFKTGDKVRMVRSRNFYGHEGYGHDIDSVQTLTCIDNDLKHTDFVAWKVESGGWVRSDDIELVEGQPMPAPEYSCIRVVPPSKPRREIVEGKHSLSNLAEFRIDRKHSDNTVNLSIDKGWNFCAKSLREFATILNEIASVLEENSNA